MRLSVTPEQVLANKFDGLSWSLPVSKYQATSRGFAVSRRLESIYGLRWRLPLRLSIGATILKQVFNEQKVAWW